MFNFIKKLGNRIKNIFNRPSYKKLYKEAIKQQEKTLEQVSQLKEQVSQMTEQVKSLTKLNEDNQTKIGEYQSKMDEYKSNMEEYESWKRSKNFIEDIKGQNTIQGIRLDLLEKLFNRGDVRLGKYSTKKPNRYITTNPDFLDKWYEVIEKDEEGYKPNYDISSYVRVINKELTYYFGGQTIFESYEYDDGEWQLFVLEDAMNKVFVAFDIEPATSDTIIRR